jgi:hypothetical protein
MNGRPSEFTSQVCNSVFAADTITPRALYTQCPFASSELGSIYYLLVCFNRQLFAPIRLETKMLTSTFLQDYLSGSCYHDSLPHDAV